MKYLPFENITFSTKLDAEEIIKRISEVVQPNKMFRTTKIFGKSDHKQYEGSIDGNKFHEVGLHDSSLPVFGS